MYTRYLYNDVHKVSIQWCTQSVYWIINTHWVQWYSMINNDIQSMMYAKCVHEFTMGTMIFNDMHWYEMLSNNMQWYSMIYNDIQW